MSTARKSPTARLKQLRENLLTADSPEAGASNPAEIKYAEALTSFLKNQDYKNALVRLEEARELFASKEEAAVCLLEQAHIYMLWGRTSDACLALETARDSIDAGHETAIEACYLLSRVYPTVGKFDAALAAHISAQPYYSDNQLKDGEFLGYKVWLTEQCGDIEGWANAVAELANECPDHLALHKLPFQNDRLFSRGEKLVRLLKQRQAIVSDKENLWLKTLEALALFIAGQFEAAGSILEELLPSADDTPAPHLVRHLFGKCGLRTGDLVRAIEEFENIENQRAGYFDLYLDLAMAHEMVGNYERALEFYSRMEEIAPDQLLPLQRSAILYESLQDRSKAVNAYERLASRDPDDRSSVVRLAILNAELGRNEMALRWLNRALKVFGSDPILLLYRARILESKLEDKEALRDLTRVLDILEPLLVDQDTDVLMPIPGSSEAPSPAGDPHSLRDTQESSFKTANRLVADAKLLQARIYVRMQRFDAAAELVDAVLVEQPENESALLLKGDLARRAGRHDQAVSDYKELIDKVLCESLMQSGLKLSLEGKYNQALTKYREAYEKFPKNWSVFYNTALAYAQLANFESVTQYLQIAHRINRDVPALVEDDRNFAIYRTTPEYQQFLESL